jgi:aminoglycoside phosphotransferase (APT) family kinase protein
MAGPSYGGGARPDREPRRGPTTGAEPPSIRRIDTTPDTTGDAPTGFDVEHVTAWLTDHVDGLVPPLRWTKLPGGHSNFTYRVDDAADRTLVVRRPPLGELLPTAHDMRREFRLISALWPTPVPVPEPLAYTADEAVTGAQFYAMGWVEGRSLYSGTEAAEHLPTEEARARTGPSFIDTLAELHLLDPDAIGLGDLGKRTSYVGRQLHRWYESWNASKDRDLAAVDRLYTFLVDHLPEQTTFTVVHGDYGLHNCRVAADGHIAAVVDWEISTLGDPLADLAYCINGWADDAEIDTREDPATAIPGFCSRDVLIDRYADRTGADLGQLDYYRCFNHWKTVCIVQGVYARYLHGQKSTEGVDIDDFPRRIDAGLQLAVDAADRLGT